MDLEQSQEPRETRPNLNSKAQDLGTWTRRLQSEHRETKYSQDRRWAAREAPQVVRVNVGQFVGVGGKTTKKELLKVLQLQYGFYPPPERMASTSFLRDLLSGEKKMVRLEELRAVDHVEAYEELSLSRLLDYAGANLPRLFEYLPQPFVIGKLSRGYVVNIMNSDSNRD